MGVCEISESVNLEKETKNVNVRDAGKESLFAATAKKQEIKRIFQYSWKNFVQQTTKLVISGVIIFLKHIRRALKWGWYHCRDLKSEERTHSPQHLSNFGLFHVPIQTQ